jgi:hypothetical protein
MSDPILYLKRGNFQDISLSTLLATTKSFNASSGCKNTSRRNLSRNGDEYIFLKTLLEEHASYS